MDLIRYADNNGNEFRIKANDPISRRRTNWKIQIKMANTNKWITFADKNSKPGYESFKNEQKVFWRFYEMIKIVKEGKTTISLKPHEQHQQ